jgi:hypothetical protein
MGGFQWRCNTLHFFFIKKNQFALNQIVWGYFWSLFCIVSLATAFTIEKHFSLLSPQ